MEALQTLGICTGSVALVAIAVMMFFILVVLSEPREEVYYGSIADMMGSLTEDKPPRGRSKKK